MKVIAVGHASYSCSNDNDNLVQTIMIITMEFLIKAYLVIVRAPQLFNFAF